MFINTQKDICGCLLAKYTHYKPKQLTKRSILIVSTGGFYRKEISLILKNKMAAAGISLKLSTFFYWLFLIGRRLNVFIGDMYNRYICPLHSCRHLTLKLLIQGHQQSAKVTHIVDFRVLKYPMWQTLKVPISPLLLVLEVCHVKPTHIKSCAVNLLVWSDLTLGPSFKVKRR